MLATQKKQREREIFILQLTETTTPPPSDWEKNDYSGENYTDDQCHPLLSHQGRAWALGD